MTTQEFQAMISRIRKTLKPNDSVGLIANEVLFWSFTAQEFLLAIDENFVIWDKGGKGDEKERWIPASNIDELIIVREKLSQEQ